MGLYTGGHAQRIVRATSLEARYAPGYLEEVGVNET